MPCVVALVPAAGRGVRLGESTPKAFVPVGGVPMIRRAVDGLLASGVVDRVVVVVPADLVGLAQSLLPDAVSVIVGGAERLESVRAGIDAAGDADFFLVHDAARALTPPELIRRVVEQLRTGSTGVVPALPVTDTVKSVDASGLVTGTPARADLRAVQTPQGFTAGVLRRAYDGVLDGDPATDDAGLVERLGEPVMTIVGDPLAFKITTPLDLVLANALADKEG